MKAITLGLWNTLICEKEYTSLRIEHLLELPDKENAFSDGKVRGRVYTSIQDLWRPDSVKQYGES